MNELLGALLLTAVADNIVLTSMLGLCPFISLSKQMPTALGVGAATTLVLTVSCALAWLINLLLPPSMSAILPLLLIATVACVVQLIEVLMRLHAPRQHRILGIFLPLIATNCAILGSLLLVLQDARADSLAGAAGAGFAYGIGFLLAMVCIASLRERITESALPTHLRGAPIVMLTTGVMALVFSAFVA